TTYGFESLGFYDQDLVYLPKEKLEIPELVVDSIELLHEVFLVLDATTGQNGLSQARKFTDSVACTGIFLSKLDGTAKGGAAVAIRQKVGLPVKYVGLGESETDFTVFDPDAFVDAMFE
ncbi:MAG: hypothetical protein IJ991_00040, partial [Thermoguttaceae bacterium]|nr:hypothetical protein [Thermoguttaceae bacterium]